MTTYPHQCPAKDLQAGQILEIMETRHIVENTEIGPVWVRVELTSGLRATWPRDTLITVYGLQGPGAREIVKFEQTEPTGVLKSANMKPERPQRIGKHDSVARTGDIVQITNREKQFYPALVTVQSVFSWGVKGYILVPSLQGAMVPMHATLNKGDYDIVGKAVILEPTD